MALAELGLYLIEMQICISQGVSPWFVIRWERLTANLNKNLNKVKNFQEKGIILNVYLKSKLLVIIKRGIQWNRKRFINFKDFSN